MKARMQSTTVKRNDELQTQNFWTAKDSVVVDTMKSA